MKLYKLKFYRARYIRLTDELAEIQSSVNMIKLLGGQPDVTIKRRDYIIKKIEECEREQMEFEKSIDELPYLDKEILMRRYKGNSYEKIASDLEISFNLVRYTIVQFNKRHKKP